MNEWEFIGQDNFVGIGVHHKF